MSVPDELRRYVPRTDLYDSFDLVHYHMPLEQPPSTASYIIFKKGNKYYAKNGTYGHIEYEGEDAATVIQSVLDALPNGGKVFIKAGNYLLNSRITPKSNTMICGEGQGVTILTRNNPDGVFVNYGASADLTDYQFIVIKDLTIDGVDRTGHGYRIYKARWFLFDNVEIKGFNIGIYAGSRSSSDLFAFLIFRDCRIWDCDTLLSFWAGSSVRFERCYLSGNPSVLEDVAALSFDNCYFSANARIGYRIYSRNDQMLKILGCQFENFPSSSCVHIRRESDTSYRLENLLMIGNQFFDYGSGYYAFDIDNVEDAYIANNLRCTNVNIGSDVSNLVLINNENYVTENSGTATIPSGSTSVTVNHGLAGTPTTIIVTPSAQIGDVWVDSVTSTSFTINCETAPSSDITVYWRAEYKP